MRVVKEISHPRCKITIYAWNNRYLIKLEEGPFEQTYKIDQSDILDENDLLEIIDAEFIQQALNRFLEMGQSLASARNRSEA
jgi:hypothetical protein